MYGSQKYTNKMVDILAGSIGGTKDDLYLCKSASSMMYDAWGKEARQGEARGGRGKIYLYYQRIYVSIHVW